MEPAHDRGVNGAVAALLRAERTAQAMTLDELSDRSGIPVVSVQRFLAARRAINLETLDCLSRALGMSPVDVLTRALLNARHAEPDLVARVRAGMARVTSSDDTPPKGRERPRSVTQRT